MIGKSHLRVSVRFCGPGVGKRKCHTQLHGEWLP